MHTFSTPFRLAVGLFSLMFLELAAAQEPEKLDNHGPHAGYVRSAGEYFVELLNRNQKLLVYLLDKNWVEMAPQDVTVKTALTHEVQDKEEQKALDCQKNRETFDCKLPDGFQLANGNTVTVTITPKKGKERKAVYEYPFTHMPGH